MVVTSALVECRFSSIRHIWSRRRHIRKLETDA
jgi:hypothetical protein